MTGKIIRIGGASAFLGDSIAAVRQLLNSGEQLDYIVFDQLAEITVGSLGRAANTNPSLGYSTHFVDEQIGPHMAEILARGIKVLANAGGVNPRACGEAIRRKAAELGLSPRIAVIEGDNLAPRLDEVLASNPISMFNGRPVADDVAAADAVVSMTAYLGAFPMAEALTAGADIVISGRTVDSAATLAALIHEFKWGAGDFDRLAQGTLAGHLIECSTQVTGGVFTDWQDVPDWENMGVPIIEAEANGDLVVTKPVGTGGLVSVGTVAEQLLYETSDPQVYIVPDVVCDFSDVSLHQIGPDRVAATGARGLSRTSTYKVCLNTDRGWRATSAFPVVGFDAVPKAERMAEAIFTRVRRLLREANLPDFTATRVNVIGSEASLGARASPHARQVREVVCQLIADHPDKRGAELMFMEQRAMIVSMAPGVAMNVMSDLQPVQRLTSFLIEKDQVDIGLLVDGTPHPVAVSTDGGFSNAMKRVHADPAAPDDAVETAPLLELAWARGGDKGELFNVGVIARDATYLPYIGAALTTESVADWFAHLTPDGTAPRVERFFAPGLNAFNYVVRDALNGGMASGLGLDRAAKTVAQQLLAFPIPVSREIADRLRS